MREGRQRALRGALMIALGALAAGCGGAGAGLSGSSDTVLRGTPAASTADLPEFAAAPLAAPGEVSGRLLYVPYDRRGCELHRYDLGSGEDETLGMLGGGCRSGDFLYGFTASPDGSVLAWRDSESHVVVREEDGRVFRFAAASEGSALGFIDYSPDGRFAVLGRREHRPLASGGGTQEAPPPLDAVVLDADTLAPRYRVPVHSEFVAWIG
jgi:hypothetical protein